MFEYAYDVGTFIFLGFYNMLLALIFVGTGGWSIWRGIKNKTNLNYTRRQLVTWQVVAPAVDRSAPLIVQVTKAVTRLNGWGLVGAGFTFILNQLIWMGFALMTNINPTNQQPLLGAVFNVTTLLSLLFGYGAGHAAGVLRLRQLAKHQPAYADIRRRTLGDYRTPIIGWLSPALTLAWIIVTAITLPHVQATNSVPDYIDPHSAAFLIEGFALPVQMLAIVVIMELVLRWVAQLPRLLIVPDPAVAQRADDIVRATTIGALQGWELIIVSVYGSSQGSLLQWHLTTATTSAALSVLGFINLLVIFSGLALYLFARGRLGGTLTGWPWQAMVKKGD